MQKNRRNHRLSVGLPAVLALLFQTMVWPAAAFEASKRYQVIPFEGRDLICEHYIFSSEEDPLAVIQQKGEISQTDFGRFLEILRKINPNLVYPFEPKPGDSLLIPLRFETVERSTGEVRSLDVPMLPIPDVHAASQNPDVPPAVVSNPSRLEHVVQPGENLFRIVLRYFGPSDWQKRVERILEINPHVPGVTRLRAGERIVLETGQPIQVTERPASSSSIGFMELLKTAALKLKGKLFASGDVYFPTKDGGDYRLDLKRYPLMEIPRQPRMIVDRFGDLRPETLSWIRGYWRNVLVVSVSPDIRGADVLEQSVSKAMRASGEPVGDGGMPGRSNVLGNSKLETFAAGKVVSIDVRDPKRAIEQFLTALGLGVQHGVQLSFPYAGTQIQTVCDLVELPSRKPWIIDFGEFSGDAAAALKACGFHVVSFSRQQELPSIVRRLIQEIVSMEPDKYRIGPLIAEDVDRIDLLLQHRAILLLRELVDSDRIGNWLRDGFDVMLFDTSA